MTAFKKPLCGLMAIIFTFVFIAATPLSVFAEDEETTFSAAEIELNKQKDKETGLQYIRIENDSAIEIVGYVGDATEVEIPARIGSLSVISIGANAFAGNEKIVSVKLHNDITSLGEAAFKGCKSLEVVEKIKSLDTIGVSCFEDCTSLKSFAIPDNVTNVAERVFANCTSLKTVEVHKNLKGVAKDAFEGTAWEKSMPDGPLSLGRILYSYKGNVKNVVVPEGVSIIEDAAFLGCESIETLELGYDVEEIGLYAFQNCVNLKSVKVNDALGVVEAGAFKGCSSLKSLDFSESTLATIGYEAFSGCKALSEVKLCETISDIGNYAFQGTSIKSISFDKNMASIGSNTFLNVKTLAKFDVVDKNKNFDVIDGVLFSEKGEKLICYPAAKLSGDEYVVPDSVKEIGEKAFYGSAVSVVSFGKDSSLERIGVSAFENSKITKITIPPVSVEKDDTSTFKIEPSTFKNATKLASVTLPVNLTYIGAEAFFGCSALKEIKIPDTVDEIANSAFKNAGLVSVNIGDGVAKIATEAFAGNAKLTDLYLGKRLEVIGDKAFSGCSALAVVNLPESLEAFSANVFADCEKLAKITVNSKNENYKSVGDVVYSADGKILVVVSSAPVSLEIAEGTEVISENSFDLAKSLKTITFPGSLKDIEANALDVTPWYTQQKDNAVYAGPVLYKVNGLIDEVVVKDGTTSIAANAVNNVAVKSVVLASTLETIGDYAFASSGLTSIVIPDSVTAIGVGAFYNAKALESVQLSNGIKVIEASVFKGCSKLGSVSIPASVQVISTDAFAGCTSLAEVKLTAVKKLEQYAFQGCTSIKEIVLPKTVETVDALTFFDCDSLARIEVADGNKKYKDIDGVVLTLGEGDEPAFDTLAIYPTGKIGKYTIPEDVKFVGDRAFYNCDELTEINFVEGFIRIGNESFFDCDKIKFVKVPESTESIGDYAFASCDELRDFHVLTNLTTYLENTFEGCNYFNYEMVYNAGEDGKSNTTTIIIIAVAVVVIGVIAYVIYNKKQKKLQKEILEKNKIKEEIAKQNEEAKASEDKE